MRGENVKPMKKTEKKLTLRVSDEQYALIQNKKEAAGYRNVSQFIRDRVLKDSLYVEHMIKEIHQAIVKK